MLPILRIIPVGGVFLAIMIVVLALEPPGGPRSMLTPSRGTLIAATEHPERWQFLIQAALLRADELSRLRELPDTPTRTGRMPDAGKIAGLPTRRADSDPDDDLTGTINEAPSWTIPVDIGETSSTELPTTTREEKPPVIKVPPRKTPGESRKRISRRTARAKTPPAVPFNLLDVLFGIRQHDQSPAQNGPAPVTVSHADPRQNQW
jgi:hypothetical protein